LIAADTSTWVAFIQGSGGKDVELLDSALLDRQVLMVPAVLAEILSAKKLPPHIADALTTIPLVEITDGYWERVGGLRAKVHAKGRKARLGDALIAQSCLDREIALITRDRDFRVFVETAGLKLALP